MKLLSFCPQCCILSAGEGEYVCVWILGPDAYAPDILV